MRKYTPERGDHLIWLDMEMTGLNPADDVPLEIASIVTDNELNILAEGPNVVIHQPDSALEAMDDWNTDHHTRSGLVSQVKSSHTTCAQAEAMTLTFVQAWTEPGKSPLCGNSIGQDRRFLRKYMAALDSHFHYRSIDTSTVKELYRRWYAQDPPPKKSAHRALDDIRESIAELRFYRDTIFKLSLDSF